MSKAALTRPPDELRPAREHQFDDMAQQTETAHLGMWLFLATEVLFFGGLFMSYVVYRISYPHAFAAGSHELSLAAGALDTAILITSSFIMALAVHAAQTGSRWLLGLLLLVAAVIGACFLVLHGYEYYHDYLEHHIPGKTFRFAGNAPENKVQLFFVLYFCMTGLHSLHVLIGVGVLSVLAIQAWGGRFSREYYNPVEVGGLYWHFVDIVWVFLFPLLYLIAPH
jgi:cytochrome c oxidase subunit 3